jgi:hypothetical protein
MKQMPIFVDSDIWSVEEGEPKRSYRLLRTYRLTDRRSPDVTVTIRFMCTFEGSSDVQVRTGVCVFVRPMRLEEERTVLLGLYADQQGGTVEVVARPSIENDPLFLDASLCVESDAAMTLLRALLVGRKLTFSLSVPPDVESWSLTQEPVMPLLIVDLPNGPTFQWHCEKVIDQIDRSYMP